TDWSNRKGWTLLVGTSGVSFERWASATSNVSTAGASSPTPGVWHHIVGTFDGSTERVYVDSKKVAEALGGAFPNGTSTLTVGHEGCLPCNSDSFKGDVDELAIYDKVLIDAQITAHYAAGK